MRGLNRKRGFTIIETVLVILVLGISLTPLCILLVNVVQKNVLSGAQTTAVSLAEAEMERISSLRFSTVDDIAQTTFPTPFTNYSYQVIVDYVDGNDLNTPVAGPTDYKRVQVKIINSVVGELTLTSLVTNDW